MTVLYLIRHGEPTYKPVDKRNFIGHGRDLAPLSEDGIKQVKKTANGIPPVNELKVWEIAESMQRRMKCVLDSIQNTNE